MNIVYKNFLIKKKTKDDCLVMPKKDGKEVDLILLSKYQTKLLNHMVMIFFGQ